MYSLPHVIAKTKSICFPIQWKSVGSNKHTFLMIIPKMCFNISRMIV